ncbi:hypothetical protein [Shimia aestuarii]|uniref:hypothetical protein n=1 Tax=Shimia aestuarii TaxID=254406 RepID=UPI001FB37D08|nr:hypothetical protein [Shimia aestuarii]
MTIRPAYASKAAPVPHGAGAVRLCRRSLRAIVAGVLFAFAALRVEAASEDALQSLIDTCSSTSAAFPNTIEEDLVASGWQMIAPKDIDLIAGLEADLILATDIRELNRIGFKTEPDPEFSARNERLWTEWRARNEKILLPILENTVSTRWQIALRHEGGHFAWLFGVEGFTLSCRGYSLNPAPLPKQLAQNAPASDPETGREESGVITRIKRAQKDDSSAMSFIGAILSTERLEPYFVDHKPRLSTFAAVDKMFLRTK